MALDSKDNDVKKNIRNIEVRLERLLSSQQVKPDSFSTRRDDEIDLRQLWDIMWAGRWWIICITFLFAIGAGVYALRLPNQYKAEVVLAPAQKDGGINSLAAQYGGLAAMAGINLGGGQSSDIDQALVLVLSRPFLEGFIEKYDIKPEIMAIKGWDRVNEKILYDENLFDPVGRQWAQDQETKESLAPNSFKAYRAISDMLAVSRDPKSGLIRLSVEHYVPQFASAWVNLLVQELNRHFQERDIRDATRNLEYLQAKVGNTSIAEMQSVFYRMIEAQMKTLMLAEVSGDYLLKPVIQASLPEEKSKPKRALICFVGFFLGGVLSLAGLFSLYLMRSGDADEEINSEDSTEKINKYK